MTMGIVYRQLVRVQNDHSLKTIRHPSPALSGILSP